MRRRQRVDAGQAARDEIEYALTAARYCLRFDDGPTGNAAEGWQFIERVEAADADELRALAAEFGCERALDWLDKADELLADETGLRAG